MNNESIETEYRRPDVAKIDYVKLVRVAKRSPTTKATRRARFRLRDIGDILAGL